jgi:hypothetical protein
MGLARTSLARREQYWNSAGSEPMKPRFVEVVNIGTGIETRNETESSSGAWLPDPVW